MDLKPLLCLFTILISLPFTVSTSKPSSTSPLSQSKQAQAISIRHAFEYQRGDGEVPSYLIKASRGKGAGGNSGGRHASGYRKNQAPAHLSPPSSFVFSAFASVVIFGFIVTQL